MKALRHTPVDVTLINRNNYQTFFPLLYQIGAEANQVVKARERLGPNGLNVRTLPGGHLLNSEHPELLSEVIRELGPK